MSPSKTKFFVFTLIALVALTVNASGHDGSTHTLGQVLGEVDQLKNALRKTINDEDKSHDEEVRSDEIAEHMADDSAAAAAAGDTPPAVKKKVVKKTPVKKTPAKKTPAKETPEKKTPAKKTPAKKTPVTPVTNAPPVGDAPVIGDTPPAAKKKVAKKKVVKKKTAKKTPVTPFPAHPTTHPRRTIKRMIKPVKKVVQKKRDTATIGDFDPFGDTDGGALVEKSGDRWGGSLGGASFSHALKAATAAAASKVEEAAKKAARAFKIAEQKVKQDTAKELLLIADKKKTIVEEVAKKLAALKQEAKERAEQIQKNLSDALTKRDGMPMKALLGDVKGAFDSAQTKVQAADDVLKNALEKIDGMFESKLAKAVGMGNNAKFQNAVINTHLRTKGLNKQKGVEQSYIKLGFKGGSQSIVDDAYLLLGYGDYPCGGAAKGGKDGMEQCREKDYSGKKKKVMKGYMVSVGATIRSNKVCDGLSSALDMDVCKALPSMKYAKLGMQINSANVNFEGAGLPSEVTLPEAFGQDKDTMNKEVKLMGKWDIPAGVRCGADLPCHVFQGLNKYVGTPSIEANFLDNGDASFNLMTEEKEKPEWVTAGGKPLLAFKELTCSLAKSGSAVEANIGLKVDFCIDKCDTSNEDDKQLLNFEGGLKAVNDQGETKVDLSLTMKGHYQLPDTTISFGNLGAMASANIGKKTKMNGFSAEGTLCIGKGCEASGGFWSKGGKIPPSGTSQSEMVGDYGLKEWTIDHDEQEPCIAAKVAIGVVKDKKTPKMAPFFYVQIPKATMGNFMAVIGFDAKKVPEVIAQSGIKDFIFSQNYGTIAGKTINPSGKGLTIPSGLHTEGKIINFMGMVDASFDLSINKEYVEGIFSLSCFKFGSILEVSKDRTQKQGNNCIGPNIKGYVGYLGDGPSGKLSKDQWCKGQFCIEGSANVKIAFLKLDMEFKMKAYKTKEKTEGMMSAKGVPFHILPGAKMDLFAKWDVPLGKKALQGTAGNMELDIDVDTTGFQELMMYPAWILVKGIRAIIYTPINIVMKVVKFVKTMVLPVASSLLKAILDIINKVDGALNKAQSSLTNGLNNKKDGLRRAGCDIPHSLIEFAESFLEENKWDGHTGIGSPTEMIQMNTKIGCFRDCPVHYPSDKACATIELECYRERARVELLQVSSKRSLLVSRQLRRWGWGKRAAKAVAAAARKAAAWAKEKARKAAEYVREKARQVAAAAKKAAEYARQKAREAAAYAKKKARQIAEAAKKAAAAVKKAAEAVARAAKAAAKAVAQLVCKGLVAAMELGVKALTGVLNIAKYLLNKVRGWTTTLKAWIDKVVNGKDTVGEKLQEMKDKIRAMDKLDLMESSSPKVLGQRIKSVFELRRLSANIKLEKTESSATIHAKFGVELALNSKIKNMNVDLKFSLNENVAKQFIKKIAKEVADSVLPDSVKDVLDKLAAPIEKIKEVLKKPIDVIKKLKDKVKIPKIPKF